MLLLIFLFYWFIQTLDNDHGQTEPLIGQGHERRTTLPSNLFHAHSDNNILMISPSNDENQITNNDNNDLIDRPRRVQSMLNATKYPPS